jgi:predicted lysophospholipase L1 biosynthesis ABC-type transport system permease subunit
MKASMYFNYTWRSLRRGGQHTLLAVFCIAVGVMAVVALQLVGVMLQNSLPSNTRDTNGGDIAVSAQSAPFKESDLSFFAKLRSDGTITNSTAVIRADGALSAAASSFQSFKVDAVDPNNYPIVSPPTFVAPGAGNVSTILTNNQVIVTQNFVNMFQKKMGDTFKVYIKTRASSGRTLQVKIAGVVSNSGAFTQAGNMVLISAHDYLTASPDATASYDHVYVTTVNQMQTDAAVKAINRQFPLAFPLTVADALRAQQSSIDNINTFLELAGLLALLIGGVGIVNTMQVLLSRRKTEIAMLKTTGYRRMDLYVLFGLEAGLLGLVGGVIGAGASIGVSFIVRALMQNMGVSVPFSINPWTVAGGVAIGLVTALIFGLMPIVKAANVRPLHVIRDLAESRSVSSFVLTVVLLLMLSVLFCALAIVILNNNVLLGVEAVYGTFAFLLLLSAFFGLVVLVVSKLPVPERFNLKHLALVLIGVALSALLYQVLPVFGILLLAVSLMGIVVVLLPRSWKVSTKMALRNIGRQRARTTTIILALFIGVLTVGMVLALGENLQGQIRNAFSQNLTYNIVVITSGTDTTVLDAKLATIPGLSKSRQGTYTQMVPVAINGQPLQSVLPTSANPQRVVNFLSSVEGYDLSHEPVSLTLVQGRNLDASDAGTDNIMISDLLASSGPFGMDLKSGDTITFASANGKTTRTATVVGIYARNSMGSHVGNVLASTDTVHALNATETGETTVTYMKIDPAQVNNALKALGNIVPNASIQNMAEIGVYVEQLLGNILNALVAIASLSVIAGVIIVANAVALAMLERRRELGILKSVGYTSGSVLSGVMIENGVIGGVGAFIAMLLVAGAVTVLGNLLFSLAFSLSPLIAVSLVGGSALLATLTAAVVAWSSVRVRPLEVLRYE